MSHWVRFLLYVLVFSFLWCSYDLCCLRFTDNLDFPSSSISESATTYDHCLHEQLKQLVDQCGSPRSLPLVVNFTKICTAEVYIRILCFPRKYEQGGMPLLISWPKITNIFVTCSKNQPNFPFHVVPGGHSPMWTNDVQHTKLLV